MGTVKTKDSFLHSLFPCRAPQRSHAAEGIGSKFRLLEAFAQASNAVSKSILATPALKSRMPLWAHDSYRVPNLEVGVAQIPLLSFIVFWGWC